MKKVIAILPLFFLSSCVLMNKPSISQAVSTPVPQKVVRPATPMPENKQNTPIRKSGEQYVADTIRQLKASPSQYRTGLICELQFHMNAQGAQLAMAEKQGMVKRDPSTQYYYLNAKVLGIDTATANYIVDRLQADPIRLDQMLRIFTQPEQVGGGYPMQSYKQLCSAYPSEYLVNPQILQSLQ